MFDFIKDYQRVYNKPSSLSKWKRILEIKSSNICLEILNFFIISALIGFFLFLSITSYFEYAEYAVITDIKHVYQKQSNFPAITLCFDQDYKMEDIFLFCTFNDNPFKAQTCSINDFEKFEITRVPMTVYCYTFNSGRNSTGNVVDLYKTKSYGFDTGLYLMIYLPEKNFIYHFVSENRIRPVFDDLIQDLNGHKNLRHLLTFEKTVDEKLGEPYNNCKKKLDSNEDYDSELYRDIIRSNISYRQVNCFELCHNNEFNGTHSDSKMAEFNQFESCSEECPLECNSVLYDLSLVSISFGLSTSALIEEIPKMLGLDYAISEEDVSSKYFELKFSNKDLKTSKITQYPKTSIVNLFSNIGGLAGLCLGISLINIYKFLHRL